MAQIVDTPSFLPYCWEFVVSGTGLRLFRVHLQISEQGASYLPQCCELVCMTKCAKRQFLVTKIGIVNKTFDAKITLLQPRDSSPCSLGGKEMAQDLKNEGKYLLKI